MALVTVGRTWVIARVNNVELPAGNLMQYVGWGTGSTAENVADTTLVTPAAPTATTRVTGTLSVPSAQTSRCVATVTAGGSLTISEVGRFNVASVGGANESLLQRHVFTGIPVQSADSVAFTLDLTA